MVVNKITPVAQKGQGNMKVKTKGIARFQRKQKGNIHRGV